MSPNDAILLVSIVVPLTITAILVWGFFHYWKDDPDQQRFRRLAEERKAQAGVPDSGPKSSSDA